MADEQLRIGIEAPELQKVISGINTLVVGIEKCITEVSSLTRQMRNFTSVADNMAIKSGGAFSKAQKELAAYKNKMLDVATTGKLNGAVLDSMTEKYNKLANRVLNAQTAVAKIVDADKIAAKEQMAAQRQQALAAKEAERAAIKSAKEQMAAQKLAAKSGDYSLAKQALSEYNLKLKDAIASGTVQRRELLAMVSNQKDLAAAVRRVDEDFRKMTATGFSVSDMFKRMGVAGQVAFGSLVSMAVRRAAIEVERFLSSSSMAARSMDGIVNAFAAGSGSFEGAAREIDFVRKTADEMGIAVTSAYEPYSKFLTSFTRSGGTIAESRQIFSDISAAAVSLHLTAEQTGNIYVALEQMANKGTVQMEELKRQLGNNLPGAFELAAEAMGITTAQLTDMMKKGQVMSSDFLPKFAAKIREVLAGSLPLAVTQAQAEFNRLSTDVFYSQVAFGKLINQLAVAFIPVLRGALQGSVSFLTKLQELIPTIHALVAALTPLAILIGGVFIANIVRSSSAIAMLTTQTGLFTLAANVSTAAIGGLNSALLFLQANPAILPLTLIAGALGFIAFNATKATNEVKQATMAMSESQTKVVAFSKSANLLSKEYVALRKNANRNAYEQDRLSEVTDELNSKYPGLISLLDKEAIAHGKITKEVAIQIAEKQKQAQINSILADQAIALDTLDKNRRWMRKATEYGQEATILDETNNKLKTVIRQYGDAIKVAGKSNNVMSGITSGDGSQKGKDTKPKDSWDKLGEEISKQEALIRSRMVEGKIIDSLIPKYIDKKNKQDEINKSMQKLTEQTDSAWDALGKEITRLEEQIRIGKLTGKNIDELIPKYVQKKKQQDDVNKSMQELTAVTDTQADAWKRLENTLKESEDTYKYMLSNSNAYTASEINKQRALMQGLKINVQYNKAVEDSADLMGMTSRTANQLTDTLVDSLFTTLGEGETVWSRFKDAGIAAMKALATEWIKSQSVMLSKGFQAGWNIQNLYDKAIGGSSTLSDKFSSGIVGLIQGAKRQPLPGTMDEPTKLKGMIDATLAVNNFTSASSNLASTAANNLTPALNNTISSISSIISPATNAATAFDKTTLGAIGMTALGAATNTMLAASAAATPVFTAMSASIAAIGTAASASAIAMAQLAVATASAQAGIGAPAAAAATSAAIIGANTSLIASYTALNALSAGAKIIPHAKGGIVSSPTMFPMQGGNIGVAGEAGTEVIAPARRMSNGDIGVGAVAPNVTINNYTNTAVEVIRRPDNETEIKITELNAMLSSSRTNKGMSSAQNRMQKNGRRIG